MLSQNIFERKCIFICGEDENLRSEIIEHLIICGIKHFYFINPNNNLKKYLEEIAEPSLLSFVDSVSDIKLGEENVIACGFKAVSPEFTNKIKYFRQSITIFFHKELGIFTSLWEKNNNVEIIEESITDYFSENIKRKPDFSPKLSYKTEEGKPFFTNRGPQLNMYRKFIENNEKRCCKIVGMKGIGKRSFIRELKTIGLDENCFEFEFIEKSDSVSFLIESILLKLGINHTQNKIEMLHFHKRSSVLIDLFRKFDSIKNAKIIFYNIDRIFDAHKNNFFDNEIELFFHNLLQRKTYKNNKIYMISNRNFSFQKIEDRNLISEIKLDTFNAEHTKFILERGFSDKNRSELGRKIMKYEDDAINNLIGGHPQIAKLFIEACEYFGVEEVTDDNLTRKHFENEKISYLIDVIDITNEEKSMLDYLSLFNVNFTLEAIKEIDIEPHKILKNLQDKFLIEIVNLSTHAEYYVPSLIKDYIITKIDDRIFKNNNNMIARFYWSKAEDLKTAPSEVIKYYRLVLYHYSLSKNKQKENELILRFKTIFLNKAREFYRNKAFEDAWNCYHELHEKIELSPKDLHFFLICSTELNKIETKELYEKAIAKYENDLHLKRAFIDYLLKIKQYEDAKKVCKEVLDKTSEDFVATNLYPKILFKSGQQVEAISYMEERIKKYRKMPLNEKTKRFLIITYMEYYNILDYYNLLKTTLVEILALIKNNGIDFDRIDNFLTQPIKRNIHKIDKAFEISINHKNADNNIYINYINFLLRQNDSKKARSILEKAKNRKLINSNISINSIPIKNPFKDILHNINIPKKAYNKITIEDHISSCEQRMQKSYYLMKCILDINSSDFIALSLTAKLTLHFEDLEIIKMLKEMYYSGKVKENNFGEKTVNKTIFISYNHKDADFVERLSRELEVHNIGVIIDINSLRFGDDIQKFIDKSIQHTDFTISIVSKNSLNSAWVIMESLETLIHEKIYQKEKFIPIFIDNCFFEDTFQIELIEGIEQSIETLLSEIVKLTKKFLPTTNLDSKKIRLIELRHNIDKILNRLNNSLTGDFSDEEKFRKNLPKLIEAIKKVTN